MVDDNIGALLIIGAKVDFEHFNSERIMVEEIDLTRKKKSTDQKKKNKKKIAYLNIILNSDRGS